MEEDKIKVAFGKARATVADLPEHLQVKAFEIAVNLLVGTTTAPAPPARGAGAAAPPRPRLPALIDDSGEPDTVDLLKVSGRNPDRYVVLMTELEAEGEAATAEVLRQKFRTYRQDVPKLPTRDLDALVAKGWVDKDKTANPLVFTLKAKGRARVRELIAKAAEG